MTSGQGASDTRWYVNCTNDVLYWQRFWDECNFSGFVEVSADLADGSAIWTCLYCGNETTTTTDALGIS